MAKRDIPSDNERQVCGEKGNESKKILAVCQAEEIQAEPGVVDE